MTQEELAERSGLSARAISNLERGVNRLPRRDTFRLLRGALDLSEQDRAALEAAARGVRGGPRAGATDDLDTGPAQRHACERDRDAPLLATKLAIPPARPALVPRPRLIAALRAGLRARLTLVSAPAGFGKTTLLSAWRSVAPGGGIPVAWVSLDSGDNDPVRFWRYVAGALDSLYPGAGEAARAILRSPEAPPIEVVLTALINGLAGLQEDAVLVLDDYHVVESTAIHDGLAFLIEHLPAALHLVVAGRADPPLPLARWRARGQLLELRAQDLRFTLEEAAQFLDEVMGLELSAEHVAALEARTEGWIAGLQLAALSMRGRADLSGFVEAFTGSHRHIVDYLAGEVLQRQPDHVQSFLLQTSILERLAGPLCDALTGRDEGQAMLERLEQDNLFVVPLDDQRRWYRYHHLFGDFLRTRGERARPDQLPQLHRRAAAWHERHGLLDGAVRHALAGQDFERAADLIERSAESMWMRAELTTLLGWLEALPEAMRRSRPRLLLAHVWTSLLLHPFDSAAVELTLKDTEAAVGSIKSDPERDSTEMSDRREDIAELRGVLAAIRAAMTSMRADAPGTVVLAHQALELLPRGSVYWRTVTTTNLGLAYTSAGDMAAASETLAEAIALAESAGNVYTALSAKVWLARTMAVQGRLRSAAEVSRQGLDAVTRQGAGALPAAGYLHLSLGQLLYEWSDLEAAERHAREGIERLGIHERGWGLVEAYALLARVRQAQDDAGGALDLLGRAEEAARATGLPWALSLVAAYRARLGLEQGDLAGAARWVESTGLSTDDEAGHQREIARMARARVFLAQGRPQEALQLLQRLAHTAEAAGRMARVVEMLALQSLALQAEGNDIAAVVALRRALSLAQPEGYVRTFVDEGAPVALLLTKVLTSAVKEGESAPARRVEDYGGRLLAALRHHSAQPRRRWSQPRR